MTKSKIVGLILSTCFIMPSLSNAENFIAIITKSDTVNYKTPLKPVVPTYTWESYFASKSCSGDISPIVEGGDITCSGLDETDANYPDEIFPVDKLNYFIVSGGNLPTMKNLTGLKEAIRLSFNNVSAIDVSGLSGLTKVGKLEIKNNPNLQNLDGLTSLNSITMNLDLRNNDLRNLDGLLSVTTGLYEREWTDPTMGLYIMDNSSLTDISGIKNMAVPVPSGMSLYASFSGSPVTKAPNSTDDFCAANPSFSGWMNDWVILRDQCAI